MVNWNEFDKGVFLVNVLAVVYDPETRLILIGRREDDPYIKELSWTFPGGRPAYSAELEEYLKNQVKTKTGLEVKINNVFFAKTYPEKREFLPIYYFCEALSGEASAGEKFVEVKWVKPTEVQNYFTTSLHPKVLEFLKSIE